MACLLASGDAAAAERVWGDAAIPPAKRWRLGDRTAEAQNVLSVLREYATQIQRHAESVAADWRIVGGAPSHNASAAAFAPVGGPQWVRDLWELSALQTAKLPAAGAAPVAISTPQVVGGVIIRQQTPQPDAGQRSDTTVREAIEQSRKELIEAGQSPVIAPQPLVVGGLLISRCLDRLRAFDLSSGRLVWESVYADPVAAELFDVDWAEHVVVPSAVSAQDMLAFLTQRVWHDLTVGTLSSDGRSVFAVEKDGFVFATRVIAPSGESPRLGPKETNRLVAYEVRTGRLRWRLGGPRGPHELPLAGVFFLGPPLPLDGRLYVLAEEGGDIRLLCLDADHGTLLWAQTIASPDLSVMDDARRRVAGLQPAYADGLLICPTGAGAVVAYDLVGRRIAWARRYQEPPPEIDPNSRAAFAFMIMRARMMGLASSLQQLSQPRWLDGTPRVAGGHVLLTPSDSNELLCYRLRDGKLMWKRPRADGLWIAAVLPAHVVVVSRGQVEAYRLADGKPAWAQPTPIGLPAGRGVRLGGRYVLPLQTNELVVVDLNDGRILLRAPHEQPVEGNLAAGSGTLAVQGPAFVAAFPTLDRLQQRIADGLQRPQTRSQALALRGEMRLAEGLTDAGLQDLQQALQIRSDDRVRTIMVGALLENLRRGDSRNERSLALIQRLIEDSPRRADYFHVYVNGLIRAGHRREAFEELLRFADGIEGPEMIRTSPSAQVRSDRWVRAQLTAMLSTQASDLALHRRAEEWIRRRLAENSSPEVLLRLLGLFGRTPLADDVRRRLITQWMKDDTEPLACEQHLITLSHSGDERTAAWANAQLLELWRRHRRYESMPYRLVLLASRFAQTPVDGKTTGIEFVRQWLERPAVRERLAREHWQWRPLSRIVVQAPSAPLQAIRRSYPVQRLEDLDAGLAGWTFELDDGRQNVVAYDSQRNERWRVSLAELSVRPPDTRGNYCLVRGHMLVFVLGETCLAVDALRDDRSGVRVLWKKRLTDVVPGASQLVRIVANVNLGRGRPVLRFDSQGQPLGNVGGLSDDVLVLQIGGRLQAVDPFTGDSLWVREGLPRGLQFSGDGHVLVCELNDDDSALVVRLDDGEALGTRLLPPLNARAAWLGRRLVSVHQNAASTLVLATDMLSGQTVWQRELVPQIRTAVVLPTAAEVNDHCLELLLDDRRVSHGTAGLEVALNELFAPELLAIDPRGELAMLELEQGRTRFRRRVHPQANLEDFAVRRSRFGYTVLTQTPINEPGVLRISGLTSEDRTVHGWCIGLDRHTGEVLWQRLIEKHCVTPHQPVAVPTLLFAARQFVQRKRANGGTFSLATYRVGMLDVRSGEFREVSPGAVTFVRLIVKPNAIAQHVEYDLGRTAVYARFGMDGQDDGERPGKD
ncbi:MAG: hypothetical protein D6725_14755 [Planctomycetota bacterium]|nr:MAG: hypothetical protein D6725_14755 [Planctomycetota bacterium]